MEAIIPQTSDWNKLQDFLKKNLRKNVNWSLDDEYPLAFSEKNIINMRIIKDKEDILAHAVLQPLVIKTHYHLFKVGLIGSVVTDEHHRGQGLSREIITSCLEASKQQGCDITMLWTDLFDFYAKFGFEVAGSEIALQVDESFKVETNSALKILNSSKVSAEALLKVYNKHLLRSVRTVEDIRKFLKIPNSEVYTAWNQSNGTLEAYCILGKGADFTNYIHEWGGNVTALKGIVKQITEDKKAIITLITPPQNKNLIKQFKDCGAETFYGVLGMIAITNPESFCKKIKKGARSLGYDAFVFEFRDGHYYFGYGDEIYQTDSPQDIVRLAFGPAEPQHIYAFSPKALEALSEIFPIPFWVWGWDSI